MARKVVETFTDDISGNPATYVGVQFAFEGVEYTIDLDDDNYAALRSALEGFVEHATKVSGPGRGRGRSASASTGSADRKAELAKVRSWAEAHDIELPARGRIAQNVMEAFHANDASLVKKAS